MKNAPANKPALPRHQKYPIKDLSNHGFRTAPASADIASSSPSSVASSPLRHVEIRDVWASNLDDEFRTIREVVTKYSVVGIDTEFPGVVARPIRPDFTPDYKYHALRCNVDMLQPIQVGLSFSDELGNIPTEFPVAWQFHFKFDLTKDLYASDSIDLLVRSGLNFDMHAKEGIALDDFGELLISSGLVLAPEVTWTSFHSGYDFAYLLKILTCKNLPDTEAGFYRSLHAFFPRVFDVKHLLVITHSTSKEKTLKLKDAKGYKLGLNALAKDLGLERLGPLHQAGSDSLLTLATFFKVKQHYFSGGPMALRFKTEKGIMGIIHGIEKKLDDFVSETRDADIA